MLYNTLARKLHRARTAGGAHDDIVGLEQIDKVINVDQDPLGNSPSSNPATYTGVFDLIRQLFAQLPEAKVRGYQPRRFSFNKPGGRCEACEGNGQKRIEMHFLPDVWVECDVCHGSRYNPETLAVQYKGKSIADVLDMRVDEALELFGNIPKIRRVLQTLADVGLGLPAARPAGADAVRRRGPARQAGRRAGPAQHRPDALHPRRADDRPALRRHPQAARRAQPPGRPGQHGHRRRAQPRRDQDGRLGHRPRPRGRRRRRPGRRGRHPRGSRRGPREPHRRDPQGRPRRRPARRAAEVRPQGRRPQGPGRGHGPPPTASSAPAAKPPWEVDGRRWHTRDRVGRTGKPGALGRPHPGARSSTASTSWATSPRPTGRGAPVVRIAGPEPGDPPSSRRSTGNEWVVTLRFHVPRNTFRQQDLEGQLRADPLRTRARLEARPKYDPQAAARRVLAEAPSANGDLGPAAQPPWEVDGRRWHTRDRVGRTGKPARWDGRILERMVDRIHELGSFAPTDWSQRSVVRIAGPEPDDPPFFEAITGNEWYVTLRFHVPRNTFRQQTLESQLGLTPFAEGPTPVLADAPRLTVANGRSAAGGDHHQPCGRGPRHAGLRGVPGPRRRRTCRNRGASIPPHPPAGGRGPTCCRRGVQAAAHPRSLTFGAPSGRTPSVSEWAVPPRPYPGRRPHEHDLRGIHSVAHQQLRRRILGDPFSQECRLALLEGPLDRLAKADGPIERGGAGNQGMCWRPRRGALAFGRTPRFNGR